MAHDIAVLVGSLRKESFNRKIALTLKAIAPAALTLRLVEVGDLPLYNEDLETATPPAPWKRFRDEMKSAAGVLFVTPEYNRSMPAAIKNAIDVGSRPWGHSIWNRKPAAVVSASPGATGGFGSNHQVRQAVVFLDMPMMQMPEAYIGGVNKLFDEKGELVQGTKEFLQKFIDAYAAWVAKFAS